MVKRKPIGFKIERSGRAALLRESVVEHCGSLCAKKNFPYKLLNAESRDRAATPAWYTFLTIRQKRR